MSIETLVSCVVVAFLLQCSHQMLMVNSTDSSSSLIFASIVFRHGARTPVKAYPNDPWGDEKFWPVGWGQLTMEGQQQHFELGTWLRRRYGGSLIRPKYNLNDIYVQSSDYDRTLQSAAVNLAAIFPDDCQFGKHFSCQLVPIHTIPKHLDYMIASERKCPAFVRAESDALPQFTDKLFTKHKAMLDFVRQHSGFPLKGMWDVQDLYDTLFIQDLYNKTLPEWTKKVYPGGGFQEIADNTFLVETLTPLMARFKYGRLLKDIFEDFQHKTDGTLVPDRSVHIYSGHDTTVAGLLNMLGLFEVHSPGYASAILVELHRDVRSNETFVQIFYRNATNTEPAALTIPNCGTSCPLADMIRLYKPLLPTHSDAVECQVQFEAASKADRTFSSLVLCYVASGLVVLLAFRSNY